MDHFEYTDGELCAEAVPLRQIADDIGTPFYCYSRATLERHYRVFAEAVEGLDAVICYAVKANSNIAVIATLAGLGAGADVVSAGEMKRALVAGIPADRIVFSGVGKTAEEMAGALKAGVMQINVESMAELETLSGVAQSLGVEASIAIRVNPDVDAETHEKIATGKSENKFGIDWAQVPGAYQKAAELPGLSVTGVAVHIGSQASALPGSPSTSDHRFWIWNPSGRLMKKWPGWWGTSGTQATRSSAWTWAAGSAFPTRTKPRLRLRNTAPWFKPWSAALAAGSSSSRGA
jgi:diaminopimelate decarboxylase